MTASGICLGPLSGHAIDDGLGVSLGIFLRVVQRSGPYMTTLIPAQLMLTSQQPNQEYLVSGKDRLD